MPMESAWQSRPARVTAEEAVRAIRPGTSIFVGGGCATPLTLLNALEALPRRPADLEFVSFVTTGATLRPRLEDRHRVFFVGSDTQARAAEVGIDYVPLAIEEIPKLLANGRLPIDVALLQIAPPDARGFASLGISVDFGRAVIGAARHVIAEVNPAMPRTHGDSFVHVSEFDALVDVTTPLAEFLHPTTGDSTVAMARYIASLIEDGATLQIGVGRLPNETLRYLTDRNDLGIHSDVISDGLIALIQAGVVTGRRKTEKVGRIVTSWCFGTRALYDLIDDNPMFFFEPIEAVCDLERIAAQHKMVSITQAFAIDFTGQVCVDQLDGAFYGGVTAQATFMRGAARSKGGKAIVCLSSLMSDGVTSRIRPQLGAGDGVGVARSDVHYVVTEYGIAYLFGRSIRERALALIEIAHPTVRATLLAEAKRLLLVRPDQVLASQASYPVQEERHVSIADRGMVLLRPARASDAVAVQSMFHLLSPDDVYTRFFRRLRTLSETELQSLCNVNHETDVAFLAVQGPRENERVIGSGCYFLNPTTNLAEIAFMVVPEWQGCRLGSALKARLREYAVARGIRGFTAEVLPGNARMLRLAQSPNDEVSLERDEDGVHLTMVFPT